MKDRTEIELRIINERTQPASTSTAAASAAATSADAHNTLANLPHDLLESEIGIRLSRADKYHLARMRNKNLYAIFKESAKLYVREFFLSVIHSEEKTILGMLAANQALLLEAATFTYCGRKFENRTALQLMLSQGNTGMITKLKPYFAKLPHGQEEMAKQFYAQFPHGIDQTEPFDFTNITRAIIKSSPAERLAAQWGGQNTFSKALTQFKLKFDACLWQANTFSPNYLLEAFTVYAREFYNFKNWDQRDSFWEAVVGHVADKLLEKAFYLDVGRQLSQEAEHFTTCDPDTLGFGGGYLYYFSFFGIRFARLERTSCVTTMVSSLKKHLDSQIEELETLCAVNSTQPSQRR